MARERTEKEKIVLDIGLKLNHLLWMVPKEFKPVLMEISDLVDKLYEIKE